MYLLKQNSRVAWSPAEWGERYGFSRGFVYKLIAQKKVRASKAGTRTIITVEADDEYREILNSTPQG